MLKIEFKKFNELEVKDLYELLQLRSEVFVVEQECIYQDIDNKDQKATHLLAYNEGLLVGYIRIFKPGDYFSLASMGRVAVKHNFRAHGYGHEILMAAVNFIKEEWQENAIKLSAQTYLQEFYQSHGFKKQGEEYLEDNIPHIAMVKIF